MISVFAFTFSFTVFDPNVMERALMEYIVQCAQMQHQVFIDIDKQRTTGSCLKLWLHGVRAKEGNQPIVMLIDEYDAPIMSCFDWRLVNKTGWDAAEHAEDVAAILKPFYSMTKSESDLFHLVFVTGMCFPL